MGGKHETTKTCSTESLLITEDNHEDLEFGEVVDLYTIQKNPMKQYDVKSIRNKPGVWVYPTISDKDFNPIRKIEVNYNPSDLHDEGLTDEEIKERLVRMFKEKLDSKFNVNVPEAKNILIRLSSRSLKKSNKKEEA